MQNPRIWLRAGRSHLSSQMQPEAPSGCIQEALRPSEAMYGFSGPQNTSCCIWRFYWTPPTDSIICVFQYPWGSQNNLLSPPLSPPQMWAALICFPLIKSKEKADNLLPYQVVIQFSQPRKCRTSGFIQKGHANEGAPWFTRPTK